ncbi:hypothetical protein FB45DRAFT_422721 [Roridomyces roridus]|uniref:Cytochrome P450 n=1 Tax=Roridomyces roridus TaxID=1738132 RepID=A0AAD7FRN0_9AGAR|nr:hypothetical protein FB45DRAFT_422721 [Roridomyces roridus]
MSCDTLRLHRRRPRRRLLGLARPKCKTPRRAQAHRGSLMSDIGAGETEAVQQFEALISMTHLLEDGGKNWARHLDRTGASMIFTVAFGSHCPTGEERDFKELLKSLEMLVNLLDPAASITNILPFLDWLPGPMPWRKRAEAYRKYEDDMYNRLFENALTGKGAGMNTWTAAFAEDKPEGDQR